jgi:hypothetical protein
MTMTTATKTSNSIVSEAIRWGRNMTEQECVRQLELLPNLGKAELLQVWEQIMGKPAPPGIRRELLVRVLEFKIREQVYGGLRPHLRAKLREIAVSLEKKPPAIRSDKDRLASGTRILREWGGETHQVTLLESGYVYRGHTYGSLSAIARKITGTQWSGPLFFGTKAKK